MSSEAVAALVQDIVSEYRVSNSINFAILTILVFDLVDSYEKEVKYFWHKPKSLVDILYFMTRYGAILVVSLGFTGATVHANNALCEQERSAVSLLNLIASLGRLQYFYGMLNVLNDLGIDLILLLRVRALYSQGKALTIILICLFSINSIAQIAIFIQFQSFENPLAFEIAPGTGMTVCFTNFSPTLAIVETVSWVVPLAYSLLLMALALYKAAQIWKESSGLKGLDLVKVLIRDQAIYFMAVIFLSVIDIVSDLINQSSMLSILLISLGNPALFSVLGAHLLFNMKEAGRKGLNQGTNCGVKSTLTGIDFAEPSSGLPDDSLEASGGAGETELTEIA